MWDDAALVAELEQLADRLPAVLAIVQCALVYVHADEAVRQLRVEVAGELHRIGKRLFAMIECVLNAFAQRFGDDAHRLIAQAAANRVAAQRQWQPGLLAPPLAEVEHLLETAGRVSELSFMDDEA